MNFIKFGRENNVVFLLMVFLLHPQQEKAKPSEDLSDVNNDYGYGQNN